jgi:hypothetical protein
MSPERWNKVRADRFLREDVPQETEEECKAKAIRLEAAFATLRQDLAQMRPDVILMIGDDQLETLGWNNNPAFGIFVGEEFEGKSPADLRNGAQSGQEANRLRLKAHPELAIELLTGLMHRGFDPAFFMDAPNPKAGIPHAFMRPAESLTDLTVPIIPMFINCFFAPQPTALRCYELGKAMGEIIEEYPSNLRVAVIGSGGLWHTPGTPAAYLDEAFDRESIRYLEDGDVRGAAEFFDTYRVPSGDASQDVTSKWSLSTGMPSAGGPQLGTREFCNWVASNAMVDGQHAELIDYVPVYASPCGMGFTYTKPA